MHQVRLWGITRVEGPGRAFRSNFGGIKPRQVLEALAVDHNRPVSKDVLAEALWEERPPASYAATLESYVAVLRRSLEGVGVPRRVVRTVNNGYVLTDEVSVDLTDVRETITQALNASSRAAFQIVTDALVPLRIGDLVASSPYARYAIGAREELKTGLAQSLRWAADGALEAGAADRALVLARQAQALEPVSDAAEQVVMRALVELDARSDALQEYADFRQRLRNELGVEPSRTTQSWYLRALAGGRTDSERRDREELPLLLRLLAQVAPESPLLVGSGVPAEVA